MKTSSKLQKGFDSWPVVGFFFVFLEANAQNVGFAGKILDN